MCGLNDVSLKPPHETNKLYDLLLDKVPKWVKVFCCQRKSLDKRVYQYILVNCYLSLFDNIVWITSGETSALQQVHNISFSTNSKQKSYHPCSCLSYVTDILKKVYRFILSNSMFVTQRKKNFNIKQEFWWFYKFNPSILQSWRKESGRGDKGK